MTSLLELPQLLERRRHELGMSKATLAERAGLSLATVNRILSGREKRFTLQNIETIARALEVVVQVGASLAFDEVGDSFDVRKRQADKKAERLVGMVQGTMGLESQAVGQSELDQMVKQTSCELLAGSPRKLWDD